MANSEIVVADKKNKGLDDHSLQMRFLRERAPQGTDSEDWSGTGNYTRLSYSFLKLARP